MQVLYLTRRNLQTLLNKLDRTASGDHSECTIVKCDNKHPRYPATMCMCYVIAVENEDYYVDRLPGDVNHKDQPT